MQSVIRIFNITVKLTLHAAAVSINPLENTKAAIIELMRSKPTISATAISDVIGTTSRGVEKNISELKKGGVLDRVGPPKCGRWVVK